MKNNTVGNLVATHIGGPTVLLEVGGLRIMTDPTLDPSGAFFRLNDKVVEKKLSDPANVDLDHIDVILLSHDQHFDNLDTSGRAFLKEAKVVITTISSAKRLQGNCFGLDKWQTYEIVGPKNDVITITATPARHGPAGVEKITGDVIGFIVSVKGNQDFEIYITGDTTFYEGVTEVSQRYSPRYVFIFAGAARPRGPFNVTMSTNDAIDTAAKFPKSILIPVHSEGWSHYTENNEMMTEAFTVLGISGQLQILSVGMPTALPI